MNRLRNYYKAKSGEVFGLLADGTQDEEITARGLVLMTSAEFDAHMNPPKPSLTVAGLKDIVTRYRWEVETGGVTLNDGAKVATGIDDQNRITTVVANAERSGLERVDFKSAGGWVNVSISELLGIASAVALHVQACFSAERAHHDAIDALAEEHKKNPEALQSALDAYDYKQGWVA